MALPLFWFLKFVENKKGMVNAQISWYYYNIICPCISNTQIVHPLLLLDKAQPAFIDHHRS